MSKERITELVNQSLESELTNTDLDELKTLLKSSKEIRTHYYELIQTHSVLEEIHNGFSFLQNIPKQQNDLDIEKLHSSI